MDHMLAPFVPLLADAVPEGFGGSVLDVGCGTGATTLALARRLSPAGHCLGVDISATMLAAARERADEVGVDARFVCADAQTHPFPPAAIDLIVSRFGVMFFQDPVAAFANLHRATRVGGTLRVVAWRSAAENAFLTTSERAAGSLLALPPRPTEGPGQFSFGDSERVRDILGGSGWSDVVVAPHDIACTLPTTELTPYLSRMGPVGQALQTADEDTKARVVAVVRDAFAPFVHGDVVGFMAACWLITARR